MIKTIEILGRYLVVVDDGISFYDISSPQLPRLVNEMHLEQNVRNVAIQGSYIYASWSGGWLVVNAEDPEEAAIVFENTGDPETEYPSSPAIAVDGHHLYVSHLGTADAHPYELHSYDITTPSSPVFSGRLGLSELPTGISFINRVTCALTSAQ